MYSDPGGHSYNVYTRVCVTRLFQKNGSILGEIFVRTGAFLTHTHVTLIYSSAPPGKYVNSQRSNSIPAGYTQFRKFQLKPNGSNEIRSKFQNSALRSWQKASLCGFATLCAKWIKWLICKVEYL